MPPRTRTKATKVLKENAQLQKKSNLKTDQKVNKLPRKALTDKTNSLSDDNASIDVPIKPTKTALRNNAVKPNLDLNVRPKRERRLPPRYIENQVLKNLSNNIDSPGNQRSVSPAETFSETSFVPDGVRSIVKNIPSKTVAPVKKKNANIESITKAPSVEKEGQNKSDRLSKKSDKAVPTVDAQTDSDKGRTHPKRNCRLQSAKETPSSESSNGSSPFKTPQDLETSIFVKRPKRICRLPSRFEDHSISPNKFIPVQPCHASTPIAEKKTKAFFKDTENRKAKKFGVKDIKTTVTNRTKTAKINDKTNSSNSSGDQSTRDTNNNGKTIRNKRANVKTKLQSKQISPQANKTTPFAKRLLDKSLSFRVLEDQEHRDNLDVYEFTYDPNEEPATKKKKRKRVVKKKPAKPKTIVLKSTYNDNVSKALASLKNKVKPQSGTVENNVKLTTETVPSTLTNTKPVTKDIPQNTFSVSPSPLIPHVNKTSKNSIHQLNYASIRIEDIAADFEPNDNNDDINYSPVNSPCRPKTPEVQDKGESHVAVHNNDPLNLQEDLSFFDNQPVASSSMNVSTRHPLASPWRVEFGQLPIKWHANTYVKPNMTPAVECSFIINPEDLNKKKHVYTNMVPDNEPLPEKVESNAPNLKQTTIIDFMREVAERSANKKKRRRSASPKTNYIFDDITSNAKDVGYKTPKKARKTNKDSTPNASSEQSNEKENTLESKNKSVSPVKAQKKKDKECTYFGFDDSENLDPENESPVKIVPNTRSTRGLRPRAVLGEFNAYTAVTRAMMPVTAKAKLTSSEVVEQLYDQLKSAEDAPQFPEKETAKEPDNAVTTNIDDPSYHENEDDSQSVHLFEDIEVVHHLKPHRKSYGKNKKVAFRQPSDSNSDTQNDAVGEPHNSSDEDDLADLSFHLPDVKKKTIRKKKPKKVLSKKEEKEVEEWAAGFNSMCEDIEEFPLVVE